MPGARTTTSTSASSSSASRSPRAASPVIAGTGSNCTAQTIELTHARQGGRRRCGADRAARTTTSRRRRACTSISRRCTTRSICRSSSTTFPAAQRGRHEHGDDGAAGEIARTSSASRTRPTTWPGRCTCASRSAASSRCCRARTRPRSPISRRRRRLHQRDGERRAAALRRDARGLAEGRSWRRVRRSTSG